MLSEEGLRLLTTVIIWIWVTTAFIGVVIAFVSVQDARLGLAAATEYQGELKEAGVRYARGVLTGETITLFIEAIFLTIGFLVILYPGNRSVGLVISIGILASAIFLVIRSFLGLVERRTLRSLVKP